jgi:hypothetical protein
MFAKQRQTSRSEKKNQFILIELKKKQKLFRFLSTKVYLSLFVVSINDSATALQS